MLYLCMCMRVCLCVCVCVCVSVYLCAARDKTRVNKQASNTLVNERVLLGDPAAQGAALTVRSAHI